VVGVILVIALLTIPGAVSRLSTSRLHTMMAGAVLIGMFVTLAGMGLSYIINAPSGATIILIAAGVYAVAMVRERLKFSRRVRTE
jgi:zinc transport system permease protein